MNRTEANEKVLEIISNSEVEIVGMDLAKNVIPGMKENLVLHAGPPITWERMCGPMKGAVIGALIYEGKAKTEEEAIRLIENGEIEFSPNHDHQTVGPMAGIITSNYPVFIIQNKTYGNFAFSNINEGAGKALRFGAYNNDVISRLHWIREKMFPILKEAIEKSGGINIKSIVTQALQMGDDNHNRNKASTALLLNELSKYLVQSSYEKEEVAKVCMHLERIDMFNVNLVMATMKSISDAIMNQDVKGSTIVAVMARNGTDFGIKLSGVKDKWFVAPANIPEGLYFPGYSEKDAAGDIGDSCITETFGLGGFSLAAAPAIVQFIGGTYSDGVRITKEMYEITCSESSFLKIPNLNFRGVPTGIDIIKVLKTGVTPTITTGIAHKDPGIGQVGAGLVKAPMECFEKAAEYLISQS
ncbi:DUF1116 domain-containing protein [Granulicatella adiacens]|jgi:putative uncharacterized protein yahG|uniref:DUF1116 domain-containing protein n=1 Tax=Granulicatella adiacens TaxID=46124 RepID=UPI002803CB9A|nr:DUF1116 domain-containing protein [uncultured Granulicatella sp.]